MKKFEKNRKILENATRKEVTLRIDREYHQFEVILGTYDEEEQEVYGNAAPKQLVVCLDAALNVVEISVGYDAASDEPNYAIDTYESVEELRESCYCIEELEYYLPFIA